MNSSFVYDDIDQVLQNDCTPALLSVRSKESARELPGSVNEVLNGMMLAVEQMLTAVIEKRTIAEYRGAFSAVFPKYAAVILALSRFANAVVPQEILQRLTWESFREREADLRADGAAVFGESIRDQALFTVWTFRKISDLVAKIRCGDKNNFAISSEEADCAKNFVRASLVANFSLECLGIALRNRSPIHPDVAPEVLNGLRAVVDAYAWIRRMAATGLPAEEPLIEARQWDEDDEELLKSSMADFGDEKP